MDNAALPSAIRGVITADVVSQFLRTSEMSIDGLMLALIPQAQSYAQPSISNFFVGAVALGASGNLYFGANFEFAGLALSFTVHGEQAAVAHALSHGETGIHKLAVSSAPCGYCRQFLYELTTATALQVLLPNKPPVGLTELLPNDFGPQDLGISVRLMSPQSHGMTLSLPFDDPLAMDALVAANTSYAPYTFGYAGVALKTLDGSIFTGAVAENAAFNPSMSPLQAAVVSLVLTGHQSCRDIVDAVLVEAAGSKASQAAATRAVLQAITSVTLRTYQANALTK